MSNAVVFFEHIDYAGKSWSFSADTAFVDWPANDQFSSMRVPPGMSVTLFSDVNFGGQQVVVTGDVPDMRSLPGGGWNDAVSSLKVSGSGGALRLKRAFGAAQQYVECNAAGTVTLTPAKTDNGKVTVTRHGDKHYDATFGAANKVLTIEQDGSLTTRAAGVYAEYQALTATTWPDPDAINVLCRVRDGGIVGGTVLQIVEE